jgi:hypothetical protein
MAVMTSLYRPGVSLFVRESQPFEADRVQPDMAGNASEPRCSVHLAPRLLRLSSEAQLRPTVRPLAC